MIDNIRLAAMAKEQGICDDWHQRLMNASNVDQLAEMYLKGIDFCLLNNYPGNDYLRRHFVGKIEQYGIHLDRVINVANERNVVCLGETVGGVLIDGFNISTIYLKDSAAINLEVNGNGFAMVDVFDNSTLTLTASDNARVWVNVYGGDVSHEAKDNSHVKIVRKGKKTY